jgi:hypothetical protein
MRLWYLLALFLANCAFDFEKQRDVSRSEIAYLSKDRANAAIFTKETARFGPADLAWPVFSAKHFKTEDGVQCISVGEKGTSIEFAVKRPLTEGETYSCLGTLFRVTQCFYECRAAIIEMDRELSGGRPGIYHSYMFLDNCRGAIVLSEINDFSKGIPINAEHLRGKVGILPHPDYPKCRPF